VDPRKTGHVLARLTAWDPVAEATVTARIGTIPWIDDADDDEVYEPHLSTVSAIERSVVIENLDGAWGGGDRAGVTLAVADHLAAVGQAGALAAWRGYWWEGHTVELWWGLDSLTTLAGHTPIFTGVITGIGWENGKFELACEDVLGALDVEIQPNEYDGSGSYGGTDDLAGTLKQIVLGRPLNVACTPVDRALGIWQVGDVEWCGTTIEVEALAAYDKAATLEIEGDTTALGAATITSGKVKTDKSTGLLRYRGNPQGQLTADVRAEAATGASSTAAGLAQLVAAATAVQAGITVDSDAFDALDTACTQTVGWVVPSGGRADDVLRAVLGSVGAFRTSTGAGLLSVALLSAPTATDEDDCDHVFREPEIEGLRRLTADPPPHTVRLGYDRNWSPAAETDIAGVAIDQGRADFLTTEYRWSSASDEATRTGRPASTASDHPTGLRGAAAAAAEAVRRIGLLAGGREPFAFTVEAAPGSVTLGQQAWIEHPDAPPIGGASSASVGRALRIVAIRHDPLTRLAEITAYG